MAQWHEEEPVICYNQLCPDYKSFELRDVEEVERDHKGDFYKCRGCNQKIYV